MSGPSALGLPAGPVEVGHPLAVTAARVDKVHGWLAVGAAPDGSLGTSGAGDLTRCSEVDAEYVAAWEDAVSAAHEVGYGRCDPVTSAAFVLGWYADLVGRVGSLCFLHDRRVPRLGRESLAFARHPQLHYPDRVALLDGRYFCLPEDPTAEHPDATVVADEPTLADHLRSQVKNHADDFLSGYRPRVRLPRRSLPGSFFDALDGGFWLGDDPASYQEVCATARLVLPGATPQFGAASTYRLASEPGGGPDRLARRRVSCCYFDKVGPDSAVCATCPRQPVPRGEWGT